MAKQTSFFGGANTLKCKCETQAGSDKSGSEPGKRRRQSISPWSGNFVRLLQDHARSQMSRACEVIKALYEERPPAK
jgi:hypothetical protein